jgi:hypothetical protein
MRSLAEAWPDEEILQQLVAKLSWSHNVRVLDQIKHHPTREWYLRAALEYGWSRDVLVLQIKSGLHEREGKALTNFPRALPPPDSDTHLSLPVGCVTMPRVRLPPSVMLLGEASLVMVTA